MKCSRPPWLLRVSRWSLGHGVMRVDELLFDYLFYPYMLLHGGAVLVGLVLPGTLSAKALAEAGYWAGFAVLLLTSTVANILYLRLYDRLNTDWFGFEEARRWEGRFAHWQPYRFVRRPFGILAFLYIAIWQNPFFATLMARDRRSPFRMTLRDWWVFAAAECASNLGWAAVVTGAATLIGDLLPRIMAWRGS